MSGATKIHNPTVEEVIDEEDIAHPPPSHPGGAAEPSSSTLDDDSDQETADAKPKKPAPPKLDVTSEEAFPALGAPKSREAPGAATWGRRPAVGSSNGLNGSANGLNSSLSSSGVPTPTSGVATPSSSAAGSSMPHTLSLPGKRSDSITLLPNQMLPRNQLKKPIPEILRDINRRSKATVQMKPGQVNGSYVFEGQGPIEAVQQALREVASQVGMKQSLTVKIPASLRAQIIGKQGVTIQALSKRTGARIQVPRSDESKGPIDDDEEIDVIVEGDPVAAMMAEREIKNIVDERTSTVNWKLRNIPPPLFPFLAGPHNAQINALQGNGGVNIKIPDYLMWEGTPPNLATAPTPAPAQQAVQPIQISGDRKAAQEARAELERRAEELRLQLTVDQFPLDQALHSFVIGDKGISLHDFMDETGCAVVLPGPKENSEHITVIGPPDRIASGLNKVEDLASGVFMNPVDVSRMHNGAPNHAYNLARYLRQRHAIEELERQYNASIILPEAQDGPTTINVCSKDGKVAMRARKDIANIVSGHPPQRLADINVDPFFHEHLRRTAASRLRNEYGVQMVFPEQPQSPHLLLVYEAPGEPQGYNIPREQPSVAELKQFQQGLAEAHRQITTLIEAQEQIETKELEAHGRFHRKLREFVNEQQKALPPTAIPAQVLSTQDLGSAGRQASPNTFAIRGPRNTVQDLHRAILQFLEEAERDEKERSYITTCSFPTKYTNILIGKQGENISKLRKEFDVDIQLGNDGKVEIKGPQAKAERAKAHIISFGKKLEDELTHVLKISPQFHPELIGAKGAQVNRLQTRYHVRINFPKAGGPVGDDTGSVTDNGSMRNRAFAADEVIIRGPSRGVEEARSELLSLLQYVKDNSFSATVSVAQDQLPSLIGQGGRELDNLRMATGAKIDVPGSKEARSASGRVDIKIRGTKAQVDAAKKLIEERAQAFDSTVTKTVEVERKFHKLLIGPQGQQIRNIVVAAGGPDGPRECARIVRFPRADEDQNTVRVEGSEAMVDRIIEAIKAEVDRRQREVSEVLEIAPEKHRMLIGRGGETRRNIESQFKVTVDIPKQDVTGPARSRIKITGAPSDVEGAKSHIQEIIKSREGETIQIPRCYHHAVADNGQMFRRLRRDLNVSVDHEGSSIPPRPKSKPRPTRINGINNENAAPNEHVWEVVDSAAESANESGVIPWILRGTPENTAQARAAVQRALESAQNSGSIGYLILPDPRSYRVVVGPGGRQINAIRDETGTKITVPRDQAKGEPIEIHGSREGVEGAKNIILDLINGDS